MLWALDEVAHLGVHWVWEALPESLGATGDSPWWIFGVLALTGFLVGLVVWKMPGHGGQDGMLGHCGVRPGGGGVPVDPTALAGGCGAAGTAGEGPQA